MGGGGHIERHKTLLSLNGYFRFNRSNRLQTDWKLPDWIIHLCAIFPLCPPCPQSQGVGGIPPFPRWSRPCLPGIAVTAGNDRRNSTYWRSGFELISCKMVGALYLFGGDWANALEWWRFSSLRLVMPAVAYCSISESDSLRQSYICHALTRAIVTHQPPPLHQVHQYTELLTCDIKNSTRRYHVFLLKWDGMRWGEMRWDEMRWDGMGWDEMRWDETRRDDTRRDETRARRERDETRRDEMRWDEMRWDEINFIIIRKLFKKKSQ